MKANCGLCLLLALSTGALADETVANGALSLTVRSDGELTILAPGGTTWTTARGEPGPTLANPPARAADGSLSWRQTLHGPNDSEVDASITARLDSNAVVLTWAADPQAAMGEIDWPAQLTTNWPAEVGRIGFLPYQSGLLLPWNDEYLRWRSMGSAHDLPLVTVTHEQTGDGFALILDTPHDGIIQCVPTGETYLPRPRWQAQLGRAGMARTVRYEFTQGGGYVALAKRYRQLAEQAGWVVTLDAKTKRLPATARLAGAPDVWGGDLAWAKMAHAAGFQRCLFNYTGSREQMEWINSIGWLTSRYDNYADMFVEADPTKWDNVRGGDEEVLLKQDGSQSLAWLTYDKKTQYLKRSSAANLAAAQRSIPPDLAAHPFLARFIDVTTADGLLEDWRPGRQQNRVTDVAQRERLFEYVQSLGLVLGGEHGRFWAMPYLSYLEGMMSGNNAFSWPAGHLRKPDEGLAGISDAYRRFGLSDRGERVPLWELVFGDCAVNYWYWGDSSDYLHRFDPAITDRKDALNVLYGTAPMYWANANGFDLAKPEERLRLWQSHDRTCLWHEQVWDKEMLDHAALSEDGLLQRTRFAGGYEAIVNLGAEPREVAIGETKVNLPSSGFVARGPDTWIEHSLNAAGTRRTRGRAPGYRLIDSGNVEGLSGPGGRTLAIVVSPERIDVAAESERCLLDPSKLVPGWDAKNAQVFELDENGQPARRLAIEALDGGWTLPATAPGRRLSVQTGSLSLRPDVAVTGAVYDPPQPPDREAGVHFVVGNRGRQEALVQGVVLVDGRERHRFTQTIAPGEELPTESIGLADGRHVFSIRLASLEGQPELLLADNSLTRIFTGPLNRSASPTRTILRGRVTGLATLPMAQVISAPWQVPVGVPPHTVRVVGADGVVVPTQVEPGLLVFEVPAGAAHGSWGFEVQSIPAAQEPGNVFAPDERGQVVTEHYRVSTAGGLLRDLALVGRPPLVEHVQYSSGQTGWNDEPGQGDFVQVAGGPVRSVLRAERQLKAGVVVTRTVYLGNDAVEIETAVTNSVTGLHNRLYFAKEQLSLLDSGARTATIDGQGDDELGPGQADWMLASSPRGALLLVPDQRSSTTYWDAGGWGGLGFNHPPAASRDWLLPLPEAPSADLASQLAKAFQQPPAVEWLP